MPASIAYHTGCQQRPFRVAGSQLSPRAITTLPTKSAVGTPPVFSDPGDRSTWEVPFFVVVVTPTNRHGTQRASASPVTVTPAVNGIQGGGQQVVGVDTARQLAARGPGPCRERRRYGVEGRRSGPMSGPTGPTRVGQRWRVRWSSGAPGAGQRGPVGSVTRRVARQRPGEPAAGGRRRVGAARFNRRGVGEGFADRGDRRAGNRGVVDDSDQPAGGPPAPAAATSGAQPSAPRRDRRGRPPRW